MQLNPNVRTVGVKPEMILALMVVQHVYHVLNLPLIVESIVDGNHDGGEFHTSSHYSGTAIDISVPPGADADHLLSEISAGLGSQYFANLNSAKSHLHISYIPTRP